MRVESIPSILHFSQNQIESSSIVGASNATHVLSDEPSWLSRSEDFNAGSIKTTEVSFNTFVLTNQTEVIAREAEREAIDGS